MEKTEKLISVVIPVWNTSKRVVLLVDQLLAQNYQAFELILIDDGSTDEALETLKQLAKRDRRIIVYHQNHAGVSVARNTGLDRARGDYVVFVDSDDEIKPGFLRDLAKAMNDNATLAVAGMVWRKLKNNQKTKIVATTPKQHPKRKFTNHLLLLLLKDGRIYGVAGKIFRMDVIRKLDLRFEVGRSYAEDLKFVLDYLLFAPGKIIFIPKALYIYNFGTETSNVQLASAKLENWKRCYADLTEWVKASGGGSRLLQRMVWIKWMASYIRSKRRLKSTGQKKYHKKASE